jgi:hypothetical protein
MKKQILLFTSFFLLNTIYGQRLYNIDKGCIKDNFEIKFVDQDITLVPDKFFSLSQLNLEVSRRVGDVGARNISKLYKGETVISYKITIKNPTDNKLYYGRIAFFGVAKKHQNEAVASYYKIAIPDIYFKQANDGMTSWVYEYYTYRKSYKFLTWIIWLSDIPLD